LVTHGKTPNAPLFPQVTVETITSVEGVEALRADYERLCGTTDNMLPFTLHEWHSTWCRHFLRCDPRIHDEPLFYLLRNAAGKCVAIAPLILSRRSFGPLKIVSISLLGPDPFITEIRAPMIERGYEHLTARAVRDGLARVHNWDWVHWSGVSNEFVDALNTGGAQCWEPPQSYFVLDLPPSWEELRSRLKRNIRESLRHCYNSLKRDGHRFEFNVIEDPAGVRQGLDRYLVLHAMRANATATAIHPDRFESRTCQEFLYSICDRLAARGAVRLFALKIGAEIVAMRLAFVVGDSLYLYYSGYDPRWARYSVMTTTVAEAIKYAIARGFKTVNLSPGREVSKMRWGPRQVDYNSAYQANTRLRSRLARSAYVTASSETGIPSRVLKLITPKDLQHKLKFL
jgi:CelD/BcsL family acetyltransferase involved in cellulose biosynthesis